MARTGGLLGTMHFTLVQYYNLVHTEGSTRNSSKFVQWTC